MHDLEVNEGETLLNKFIENKNMDFNSNEDSKIFYETGRFEKKDETDSNLLNIFNSQGKKKIHLI